MMNENLSADDVRSRMSDSIFLNEEEYTSVLQTVIETPEQDNVLINAFPPKFSENQFKTWHEYRKLDKYGNATESDVPGDADAIEVNGTKVRVQLPFYHADFLVDRFERETSRALGEPLDTLKARVAARKVNDLLDEAMYSRSSIFGTLGAHGLFTGTAAAAGVWSGTGPDIIFNDIVAFVNTIPVIYKSQDMRIILHATNIGEMNRTNSFGLSARRLIRETYPGLQIIESKQVTEGAGLLYPFRDDVAYIFHGMPLQSIEWEAKPWQARFKAVRSARLIVVAPTAGVKLSGL